MVIVTVIVVTLVPLLVTILTIFLTYMWYRMCNRSFKEDPPTYIDLLKMSTIYDDIQQDREPHSYQQESDKCSITYMDLLALNTGID